jgi:hypothetical protein
MAKKFALIITVAAFVGAGSLAYAAADPPAVCKDKKAKATGKKVAGLLKAFGKNEKKPYPAKLAVDISKAQSKFTKSFTKAESKSGCLTSGDSGTIEGKVDAFVADVIADIADPGECTGQPDSTPCTDNDSEPCTHAGCQSGACVQTHVTDPDGTACGPGSGCDSEECISGVCTSQSACCTGLSLLSFTTGPGTHNCGTLENYRCSNDANAACADAADCDFGLCIDPPGICDGNVSVSCSGAGTPCTGTCNQVGGTLLDLDCGGLYFGGGNNSGTAPRRLPDMAEAFLKVTDCNSVTGDLTLGHTTQADLTGVVPIPQRRCTQGRTCSTAGTNCAKDSDCPATQTCDDNCLLGPPLPFPDGNVPPTSVCLVNVLAEDASGNAQCAGGAMNLRLPLRSAVFLTGDILSSTAGPVDVAGIQPCALCSPQCVGGADDQQPCQDNSDCDGNVCDGTPNCVGGIDDGDSCTPGSSAITNAYPTSHDCRVDPGTDITTWLGGLPVSLFGLTNESVTVDAVDQPESRRTFCGFCRDSLVEGSSCFDGDPDDGQTRNCPDSVAQPTCLPFSGSTAGCGNAVPCNDDFDCTPPYESCAQRNPGAFAWGQTTRITVNGSTDGGCLADGAPHATDLVSFFCVPPFFDSSADAAADLPGPGAAMIEAESQLLP